MAKTYRQNVIFEIHFTQKFSINSKEYAFACITWYVSAFFVAIATNNA